MGRSLNTFSDLTWSAFKEVIDRKNLNIQWVDQHGTYFMLAIDDCITYECQLLKSEYQDEVVEFEATYKDISNKKLNRQTATTGVCKVAIEKPDYSSKTIVTHDWCDPCTWYQESERVSSVVLTQEGETKIYTSTDMKWIDVLHGRISDEDELVDDDGKSLYAPIVKDNSVELTEDLDYTIDYENGKITLADSYTKQGDIVADYSKSTTSCFTAEPKAEKILNIEHTELNFSRDAYINTPINFEIWVYNPYFNPGEPEGPSNPLRIPYKSKTYKNEKDIINNANLGQGYIPRYGNLIDDVIIFPFNYVSTKPLKASQGAQLKIVLHKDKDGNNIPLTGSYGTLTIYATSHDE